MNKQSLGALIALNVVLLVALVLTSLSPNPAYAQLQRAEYIMMPLSVTGRAEQEGVIIVELSTARMIALFADTAAERVDLLDHRNLLEDMQTK